MRSAILRGVRWAAALLLIGLIGAMWQYREEAMWPSGFLGLLLAVACWLMGRSKATPSRAIIAATWLGVFLTAAWWLPGWVLLARLGLPDMSALLCWVSCIPLSLILTGDLLVRRWRGVEEKPPNALRWQAAGSVAAIVVVVVPMVVLSAVVPRPLTRSAHAVPALEMPRSVAGEVTWSLELDQTVFDVVPGVAGPILVTDAEVKALHGGDGSTLWSYRIEQRIPESPIGKGTRYALTSPDRRRVLFLVEFSDLTQAVILDTATGATIARTFVQPTDRVQLTNRVALVGHRALSLANGREVWSLDEPASTGYTGTAGRNTLILERVCDGDSGSDLLTSCTLTLADDEDPTRTRTLEGVVKREGEPGPVLADGWVVRHKDGAYVPVAERSPGEPGVDGGEMEAVNIDSVTESVTDALPAGVESVDLGVMAEPDPSSVSLLAMREAIDPDAKSTPDVVAVFDPATRKTTPVIWTGDLADVYRWNLSPDDWVGAWPTSDVGFAYKGIVNDGDGVELTRTDGSSPIGIELDPELTRSGHYPKKAATVAAPGGIVVWVNLSDAEREAGSVVYGLR